jgi:AraC-like DNA-binding protein
MSGEEWGTLRYNANLNIELFHACCVRRSFPVHMHDYYVICLIDKGRQAFSHRGARYATPAGGLILLNPGDDHTGEPVDERGFEYRAIYPTCEHMREAASELTGRQQGSPLFAGVRVDDRELAARVRELHAALMVDAEPLESEGLFIQALTGVLTRTAGLDGPSAPAGKERQAVARARRYIEGNWSQKITLGELAAYVGLSRYYFLRVFCGETGMPPHAYQDSVRLSHAKRLLKAGLALREVAAESGFSDQSHFANRFRRLVGVTPGYYVRECCIKRSPGGRKHRRINRWM